MNYPILSNIRCNKQWRLNRCKSNTRNKYEVLQTVPSFVSSITVKKKDDTPKNSNLAIKVKWTNAYKYQLSENK